jgi:hypothetical protein
MRIGDDVRLDLPSLMNTCSDTILSCHRGLATPDRRFRALGGWLVIGGAGAQICWFCPSPPDTDTARKMAAGSRFI